MSQARILVVDDEEAILLSYRSILLEEDKFTEIDTIGSALFNDSISVDEMESCLQDDFSEIDVEDELQTGHYDLDEALNGQDAIELVKTALEKRNPYALMFIDVRMPPGIDGVETARIVRQMDPDIEIVIMTAYSDYSFEEIVDKVGNPDQLLYFHKPFKTEQIQTLASSLTQKWFLTRKTREQDER